MKQLSLEILIVRAAPCTRRSQNLLVVQLLPVGTKRLRGSRPATVSSVPAGSKVRARAATELTELFSPFTHCSLCAALNT